ncbi:MAG: type I 3-dehydroquinate dehydratase [Akkermansiaceae bacterium]|nr:type I 3-dehydroquinate dehydratase [Akkermansiaceae bacterium]
MATSCPILRNGSPLVVGSAAGSRDLEALTREAVASCCELLEVRLDLLEDSRSRPWQHLSGLPILFTARRRSEGGAGNLAADQRCEMLRAVLGDASLIDIELASIEEMAGLIQELEQGGRPWIASFHDFDQLPDSKTLEQAAAKAREAGAQVFKLAAQLNDQASLERLVEFQRGDHGIPTATMGMGELAAESRLRCAEAGSVLNYGYLGDTPTAPGQWSAWKLKQAIAGFSADH